MRLGTVQSVCEITLEVQAEMWNSNPEKSPS
jgi:hypothetical protein